jgi:hypothetical protein
MTHVWVAVYWKSHPVTWIDEVPITGLTARELTLKGVNALRSN